MLDSGRYLYVLFCCQQSVEKMLKCLIVERTQEFPPRLHSLPRLAVAASLTPDATQAEFLALLTAYYIQSRYPEEVEASAARVTREAALETVRKTEEALRWLQSQRP